MHRTGRISAALLFLTVAGGAAPPTIAGFAIPAAVAGADVSIMTYNVRGLPWPLASGRTTALEEIAERLRVLRADAKAPQVVVLEEAFTGQARSIGRYAGYAHVVDGSGGGRPDPAAANADAEAKRFAAGARWWRGEDDGAWVGSGLQILTDFPVIAVRRISFGPSCAGYDCLAAKGALLVRLRVPGVSSPVDVVATHMNSRGASGAPDERSDAAHAMQSDELTRFVAGTRDPRAPLVVAGDFNVGRMPGRRRVLFGLAAARWSGAGPVDEALEHADAVGMPLPADARSSLRRSKDLAFYAPGEDAALSLVGVSVPFGRNASGEMLSDHVGYAAHFRIVPRRVRTGGRPIG